MRVCLSVCFYGRCYCRLSRLLLYCVISAVKVLSAPDGESENGEAGSSPALSRNCNPDYGEARSPALIAFCWPSR
jgi:hypothetical protein